MTPDLRPFQKLSRLLEARQPDGGGHEAASAETRQQLARCADSFLELADSSIGGSGRGAYLAATGVLEAVSFCISQKYKAEAVVRVARQLADAAGPAGHRRYSIAYSTRNQVLDCEVFFQSGDQSDAGLSPSGIQKSYIARPGKHTRLNISENQAQAVLADLRTLTVRAQG